MGYAPGGANTLPGGEPDSGEILVAYLGGGPLTLDLKKKDTTRVGDCEMLF